MKPVQITRTVNGVIVSSLWMYHVELPSRHLAVIEEVWTDPKLRRQGMATELIKQGIELAKRWGCNCIELTVREDKPEIQAFYRSLGFFDRQNRAYRLKLGE